MINWSLGCMTWPLNSNNLAGLVYRHMGFIHLWYFFPFKIPFSAHSLMTRLQHLVQGTLHLKSNLTRTVGTKSYNSSRDLSHYLITRDLSHYLITLTLCLICLSLLSLKGYIDVSHYLITDITDIVIVPVCWALSTILCTLNYFLTVLSHYLSTMGTKYLML